MKLATYESGGQSRIGIVDLERARIFDLAAAASRKGGAAGFGSMLDLIDAGDRALDQAAALFVAHGDEDDLTLPLAKAKLQAPLPVPRQIRDGSLFPLHLRQGGRGVARLRALHNGDKDELERLANAPLPDLPPIFSEIPIYYISNRFGVRGHQDEVVWPRYSSVMDYELEFGIVTKGTGADIKASDASARIFGFTIFNDFSARDVQAREMLGTLGPTKGKSFDGGNVLGPWIVTPDELGDPYALNAQARVNGEIWSQGTTEGMLFSFEEFLAYVSRDETIMPGEFLGSGTLGNGCGLELGKFLSDGDVVELEFDRLGLLRNRVVVQPA